MKDKNKLRIENSVRDNGVSIWLNDRWILDASTFLDDEYFTIDTDKFVQSIDDNGNIVFTLKRS